MLDEILLALIAFLLLPQWWAIVGRNRRVQQLAARLRGLSWPF